MPSEPSSVLIDADTGEVISEPLEKREITSEESAEVMVSEVGELIFQMFRFFGR